MTGQVVLRGPLRVQQRLGLAVPLLLLPIPTQCGAAVVPHDRRRTEAELPPAVAYPPAHVDVIARRPEQGVEPADSDESAPTESHVTARDVLCLPIAEQYVDGAAGSVGHTV